MAHHRFTDTEKWKKKWFRLLSPEHKCFWSYITDTCDCAGVWDPDIALASVFIGYDLDEQKILHAFDKQIIVIENGSKWFVKDFIEFQQKCSIWELNPANNAHKGILRRISKYNLYQYFDRPQEKKASQGDARPEYREQVININDKNDKELKAYVSDLLKAMGDKAKTVDILINQGLKRGRARDIVNGLYREKKGASKDESKK